MKTGDDERRLWLEVIKRAMDEAAGVKSYCGMLPGWSLYAQKWLTSNTDQFLLVCHLAGLSTEQYKDLRKRARAQYRGKK
jgi:hypothetical protein